MKLNQLFMLIRELQDKKQTLLAGELGLKSASAISKYELEKTKLSEETLRKLAELLQMNPEYVSGSSGNPFLSSDLIKMYLPEKDFGTKVLFTPILVVAEANQRLEIITLLPARKFECMETIETGTLLEPGPYAIAVKDQDNNIFLFRRKSPSAYIVADRSLMAYLEEVSNHGDKDIRHRTRKLSRDLFEKIRDWRIEKEDIAPFFSRRKSVEVTDAEEKLLIAIRKKNIDPSKAIEYIEKIPMK